MDVETPKPPGGTSGLLLTLLQRQAAARAGPKSDYAHSPQAPGLSSPHLGWRTGPAAPPGQVALEMLGYTL